MSLNVTYVPRSLKCREYQFEFVSMWTSLMSAGLHLTININSAPNFKIQKGQHRSRVDSKAVANPFHDSRTSVHFFTAIRHLLTCIAPRGARGGSLISIFNKNYRQIWRLSSQIWIQILCQVRVATYSQQWELYSFSTSYQNTADYQQHNMRSNRHVQIDVGCEI